MESWSKESVEADISTDMHPWLAPVRSTRQMVRSRIWELALEGRQEMGLDGSPDPGPVEKLAIQDALLSDIHHVVNSVTEELFQGAVTPAGRDFLSLDQAYRRVSDMAGEMMDQDIRNMMDRLYLEGAEIGRYCPMFREYNLVARNKEVFARMLEEAPGVLRFYCHFMALNPDGPWDGPAVNLDDYGNKKMPSSVFKHPREVTELVKSDLGLSPFQWRYFSGLWEGPEGRSTAYRESLLRGIRLWARFLPDVTRPEVGRRAFLGAARLDHGFYSEARWRHGDPWRAWVHLRNQFLATDSSESGMRWMSFDSAADAVRWHIDHEQPWGPTSWPWYQNRSARWHLEMTVARHQKDRSLYQNACWERLVGEVDLGGLRAVPITEGGALYDLAREIGNYLASYVPRCEGGGNRVLAFCAADEESGEESRGDSREEDEIGQEAGRVRLAGAVELRRDGKDSWRVGQIEGSREPSSELVRAMGEIGKM